MILLLQEISVPHNLQLKARAQRACRKMQCKYIYKNKNWEKRTKRAQLDISTTTPWTVIQSTKKKRAKQQPEKEKKKKKKVGKPKDYLPHQVTQY